MITFMSQSLSKIYIHLIFHIKTSSPVIFEEDLCRLHAYMAKVLESCGCVNICTSGIRDHVHVLFLLSRDVSVSHVVEELKRNSSRWIKQISSHYKNFSWQGGYGAFSVSQSVVEKTKAYINNQEKHHRFHSFAEEYRMFLDTYEVKYNDEYVFKD